MSEILRFPTLLFAFGVDRLRRLPGARLLGPLTKWIARLLLLAAVVLLALWGAEASPQRMSLADLAAGRLGWNQSWIIVSGNLSDEQGSSSSLHVYRLTDPAAPNAFLVVRSRVVQSLGPTTLSGRIEGGRDGVPPGYAWSARLNADLTLAGELPPPWSAIVLAGVAVVIMLGRRTRYPVFQSEPPLDVAPVTGSLRVTARSETDGRADPVPATLSFANADPGSADLSISGSRSLPVRLHSAFTKVDVGVLRRIRGSEPALRVRSENDDLALVFASKRDRDGAFAALRAETQLRRTPQPSRAAG